MKAHESEQQQFFRGRVRMVFVLFAIVAGFLIFAEHRVHVVPYLPWLLLAACPLMHLFMHHGHRHGGGDAHCDAQKAVPPPERAQGGTGDRS